MGRLRADNAACAICMDSLFTKLDDLDQLVPACAPDCGHVFHEECLQDWFRAQSVQYLAQAREHRLDRDPSPTLSDAPAYCPTCRSEVFADQETGEPVLHRLYINYGDEGAGSSQVGSSPVKPTPAGKSRKRDSEVMGIARRAKGISEEVTKLNEQSSQQAVDGLLSRAEGLKDDAVSVKAIQGVKTYIGGLTIAINNLRSSLAQSPLPTTLQVRIDILEDQLNTMARESTVVLQTRLPAAVKAAKAEERKICEKATEKAKADLALVTRGFEKEKIARREQRKAAEEREQQFLKQIEELRTQLKREEEERVALQETVRERTKLLRQLQSKSENRKELKDQNEQLEQENKSLREKLATAKERRDTTDRSTSPQPELHAESSDRRRATPVLRTESAPEYRPRIRQIARSPDDDSLEIELPSFIDDPSRRHLSPKKTVRAGSSSNAPRAHPTARTFTFNEDDSISAISRKRKPNQSKYFQSEDPSDNDLEQNTDIDDSDIIIQASSPQRPSPTKRSRTNPFTTTKEAHTAKTALRPKKKDVEVIDLASSSPGTPFKSSSMNIPRTETSARPKQKSTLAGLFTDANGRPKKGLATGTKVKHRV